MSKHFSLYFLVFLGIGRIAYGSYEVRTIDIPELHGRTIQADYITTLNYDFSDIVDDSEAITRFVISVSGNFTPGFGDFLGDGNYALLDGSEIMMEPFDNHIHLGRTVQFSEESTVFSAVLDSQEMIGADVPGIWDGPYQGYSGDTAGSISFIFGQLRNSSTVIETWPTIEITEATYTIYIVPEPGSLVLLGCGVLFLRRRT